jgi:hypothetical protein
MRSPPARLPASWWPGRRLRWLGLVAVALLVLALSHRPAPWGAGGQSLGGPPLLVNPCTGETIALRESAHLLPHLSQEQAGSREASVNAVGVSGVGSRGTYYLPMGTGKLVLTLANGTFDFAMGSDLELIGRGNQGHDFLFHSLAHLKLSTSGGVRGSGLTMRARCE